MNKRTILRIGTLILLTTLAFLLIRYIYYLTNYLPFGDESETIVTARMMANGRSLYSEIFNHHGPLTFLPALFCELIAPWDLRFYRIIIIIGQFYLLYLICTSSILSSTSGKLAFLALTLCCFFVWFPKIYGHLYLYQTLAGLLIGISMLNFVLPSLFSIKISEKLLIPGIASLVCLPFLAFTYIPLSATFLIACSNRKNWRIVLKTIIVVITINCIYLYIFGSFKGYAAYHFYMNLSVLPKYSGATSLIALIYSLYTALSTNVVLLGSCLALGISLALLWPTQPFLKIFCIFIAIGTLLLRPIAHHLIPFYYATLFSILVIFKRTETDKSFQLSVAILLSIYFSLKISLIMPIDRTTIKFPTLPNRSGFSNLSQILTNKHDSILAYSFRNDEYLLANRLPASGYFFYLPWQHEYNSTPFWGVKIDPAKDILSNKPKIIMVDKWKVWDKYNWDSYAQDINSILRNDYLQLDNNPYYVRKDLIRGPTKSHDEHMLVPSKQLKSKSPIVLTSKLSMEKAISSVYILLGTYHARNIKGTAYLVLENYKGEIFEVKMNLEKANDNSYLEVKVPTNRYKSMQIRTQSENISPISVWERLSKSKEKSSCLIYKYIDNKYGFTPGCSLM